MCYAYVAPLIVLIESLTALGVRRLPVCHNFLKGKEVTLPCSYRGTFWFNDMIYQNHASIHKLSRRVFSLVHMFALLIFLLLSRIFHSQSIHS